MKYHIITLYFSSLKNKIPWYYNINIYSIDMVGLNV